MKITRKQYEVVAGDIAVQVELDGALPVTVTQTSANGESLRLSAPWVERLAVILRELRAEAGDSRRVCATHGYLAKERFYCKGCDPLLAQDEEEKQAARDEQRRKMDELREQGEAA